MRAQRPRAAAKTRIRASGIAQRKFISGFKVGPLGLIWNAVQHSEHRIILAKNAANGGGGVNAQRLEFAQQEESEDMVEIGVGERDAGDRRVTPLSRMQFRRRFDLGEQVRRCSQQKP